MFQILLTVEDSVWIVRIAQPDHLRLWRYIVFQLTQVDITVFQLRREQNRHAAGSEAGLLK